MKALLIAVLLFSCTVKVKVYGQALIQNACFKDGDAALNKFLNKHFALNDDRSRWPGCTVSVIFVKFNIDTAGNVANIDFSKYDTCPGIFKLNLKKTTLATNGMWIPARANGKAVASKPFILPFVCDLEAGCAIGKDGKRTYKPLQNSTQVAVEELLNFKDSAQRGYQIDCTLLEPLQVFSIE